MLGRLNVTPEGPAASQRHLFDQHLNECERCTQLNGGMCDTAEALWRSVMVAALRAYAEAEGQS